MTNKLSKEFAVLFRLVLVSLVLVMSGCSGISSNQPAADAGSQSSPSVENQRTQNTNQGHPEQEPTKRALDAVVSIDANVVEGAIPGTAAKREQRADAKNNQIHYRDPLKSINRAVFAFNDVLYRYALIPASQGYYAIAPVPVRESVDNFFHNLRMPIRVVNHALQLNGRPALDSLFRFSINSTAGVLGFFDPAQAWLGIERQDTSFGATLERYGAGYGFYLVMPVLGPSNLRDGSGALVDSFMHPANLALEPPESTAVLATDAFQTFAPLAENYKKIREEVDDPYTFFRNMHIQGLLRDRSKQQLEDAKSTAKNSAAAAAQ